MTDELTPRRIFIATDAETGRRWYDGSAIPDGSLPSYVRADMHEAALRVRIAAVSALWTVRRERDAALARVASLEEALQDILEAYHEGHEEVDGLMRRARALLAPSDDSPSTHPNPEGTTT